MKTLVENLPDKRHRVWDGKKCTRPLGLDEVCKQLQSMAQGQKLYEMKTPDEWYQDDLRDLDRMENQR